MNSQEPVNFAELCKNIRAAYKKTQKEMATLLGIKKRTYERYEAGTIQPSGQIAWKLFNMQQELNRPIE